MRWLCLWTLTAGFGLCQPAYVIYTRAGSDAVGDGGFAVTASFSQPEGIAIDRAGNVYVADAGDHRVRRITPDGLIQTWAGTGRPGFQGDGGPATAAQLRHPYGLAIDANGNLYVADLGNARVRRISAGGVISTAAGGGAITPGGSGDGGPATAAKLSAPRNVAVDASGELYIADFKAHCVYRVSTSGTLITIAGNGGPGSSGDGGPATQAQLAHPAGLSVDAAGTLWIADSGNRRIRRWVRGVIQSVAVAATLFSPTGLAVDASGNLYIADGQVLRISASGVVSPVTGAGREIAVDSSGAVYISSGSTIRRISATGTTLFAGAASYGYAGDGGPPELARFNRPSAVAVDPDGNIYLADERNHRVRRISAAGLVSSVAGSGERGYSGDGRPAVEARLDSPAALAVDRSGVLYISDSGNHRVRRVTPDGLIATALGAGSRAILDTPGGLVFDDAQNLYISDMGNRRVLRLDRLGALRVMLYEGAVTPRGLSIASNGDLLIADPSSDRIARLAQSGGVTTFAAGLRSPAGIAADNGAVLVAESGSHRVVRLTTDGGRVVVAGTGVAGFSGDGGPASEAHLDAPLAVALAPGGEILIADTGNQRIRRLRLNLTPPEPVAQPRALHAATLAEGPYAAGQLIAIDGLGGPDLEVRFDDEVATPVASTPARMTLMIPEGARLATLLEVSERGHARLRRILPLARAAIGIFTREGEASRAAALNEDGSSNSPSQPAPRGSVVSLFATGAGQPPEPLTVELAGVDAGILFAGPAPGYPGVVQVNGRIPVGFFPAGPMTVTLRAGSSSSQSGVVIWVQ